MSDGKSKVESNGNAILCFFQIYILLPLCKFSVYTDRPYFPHLLPSLTNSGDKFRCLNHCMKLTFFFSFFFFKYIEQLNITILEAWLFPCIPMVISISSSLINTISRGKKKICFLFDFSHPRFYKSKTFWKSYLMPIRLGNPWFCERSFSQLLFHCLHFCF